MKTIPRHMTLCFAAGLIASIALGCGSDGRPEIAKGVDACSSCQMVIDRVNEAAGYYVEKEFNPFCSPGCLLKSFEDRRKRGQPLPGRVYFADYLGTGLQPSDSTTFLLTRHIPSVMDWGIIGFAGRGAALDHRRHDDESVLDWIGLRTHKGIPDRKLALVFTADGSRPEVVELTKGELVEWEVAGRGLESDLTVELTGYAEMGSITIPASGETVRFRFLATRPGSGFAFVETSTGKVLGQVRVAGAHTAEEEDM